jgi:hypothetical protein
LLHLLRTERYQGSNEEGSMKNPATYAKVFNSGEEVNSFVYQHGSEPHFEVINVIVQMAVMSQVSWLSERYVVIYQAVEAL